MVTKIKCPKCGSVIEIMFHTNHKTGRQEEGYDVLCSDCKSLLKVELEELIARTTVSFKKKEG